jgi:hypothetical protein
VELYDMLLTNLYSIVVTHKGSGRGHVSVGFQTI